MAPKDPHWGWKKRGPNVSWRKGCWFGAEQAIFHVMYSLTRASWGNRFKLSCWLTNWSLGVPKHQPINNFIFILDQCLLALV